MNEILQVLDVDSIINVVLFILASLFGGKLLLFKNKTKQLIALLESFTEAIQDNKISEKELKDIVAKFKALIGKKTS